MAIENKNINGHTPLFFARDQNIAKLLIEKGAQISAFLVCFMKFALMGKHPLFAEAIKSEKSMHRNKKIKQRVHIYSNRIFPKISSCTCQAA